MPATPSLVAVRGRSIAACPGDGTSYFIGVLQVYSITPVGGPIAFQQALLAIAQDPQIRELASRLAGDPGLAEDALQEAYYAVRRTRNPEEIKDLRAYFCTVLSNKVRRFRGQLREAVLLENFEYLAEAHQGESSCNLTSVEETVSTSMACQAWLERFAALSADLCKVVPGRSDDPDRYRDVIVAVADLVLLAIVRGDYSPADSNQALRAAYREWFGSEACAADNAYQRFCRARADVRDLLKCIISRDELRS